MLVCSLLSPEEKMRVAVGIAKVEEIILSVRVLPKSIFPRTTSQVTISQVEID